MVYAVQLADRKAYCSSPHCIASLVRLGWRLSDPEQLGTLVQALMTVAPDPAHDPSEHWQPDAVAEPLDVPSTGAAGQRPR